MALWHWIVGGAAAAAYLLTRPTKAITGGVIPMPSTSEWETAETAAVQLRDKLGMTTEVIPAWDTSTGYSFLNAGTNEVLLRAATLAEAQRAIAALPNR